MCEVRQRVQLSARYRIAPTVPRVMCHLRLGISEEGKKNKEQEDSVNSFCLFVRFNAAPV